MAFEIFLVCTTLQHHNSKGNSSKTQTLQLLNHQTLRPSNPPTLKLSRHNPFKPFRSLVTRNIANNHAAHYFSELPVVARVASHIMAGLLESLAKSMGTFCDRHSQKLCIAIDIHNNCALQWLQIAKSQTWLCRRVVLLSATFHMEAHSSHEIVQSVHPVARQVVPVNYRFHAPVAFWYLSQSLGSYHQSLIISSVRVLDFTNNSILEQFNVCQKNWSSDFWFSFSLFLCLLPGCRLEVPKYPPIMYRLNPRSLKPQPSNFEASTLNPQILKYTYIYIYINWGNPNLNLYLPRLLR